MPGSPVLAIVSDPDYWTVTKPNSTMPSMNPHSHQPHTLWVLAQSLKGWSGLPSLLKRPQSP